MNSRLPAKKTEAGMVRYEVEEKTCLPDAGGKGRSMIGNVNAVVKMKRLGKVLQKEVRSRKRGLFRNTLIPD